MCQMEVILLTDPVFLRYISIDNITERQDENQVNQFLGIEQEKKILVKLLMVW